MKKKTLPLITLITMVLAATFLLSACTLIMQGTGETLTVTPTKTNVSLYVGQTHSIKYDISDKTREVNFVSSDKNILSVDSVGTVTAKSSGRARISLNVSGITKASVVFDVTYFVPEKLEIEVSGQPNSTTQEELAFSVKETELALNPSYEFYWTILGEDSQIILERNCKVLKFTPQICGKTYTIKVVGRLPSDKEVSSDALSFGWFKPIEGIQIQSPATKVEYGQSIEITAEIMPEGSNANAVLEWRVITPDGEDRIIENASRSISFAPSGVGIFKIRAIWRGQTVVESNEVSVESEYASVKDVVISAKQTKLGLGEKAEISVSWNKEYVNPNGVYTLNYVVGGVVRDRFDAYAENVLVFRQNSVGEYVVSVRINGVSSNEITFIVVANYPTAHTLSLTAVGAEDNRPLFANKTTTQFTVQNDTGFYNPSDVYTWYVNGEKVAEGKDLREFTLTKSISPQNAAEYHVHVKCGKLESRVFTVVLKGVDCVTADKYFEFFTAYGGYLQNSYITSQEEFGNLLSYVREEGLYQSEALELYVDYAPEVEFMGDHGKINLARDAYEEAGTFPGFSAEFNKGATTGTLSIRLQYNGASAVSPTKTEAADNAIQSDVVKPNYGKGVSRLPCDDFEPWPSYINTTNLLYKVLSWGYRPEKANCTENVWKVYTWAKNATASIVSNDMTDVEKALAVYDYICYEITYDFRLAATPRSLTEGMQYDGYYLEGVFLKKKAVCDGKSKAFVLMAGMLGLKSLRATGDAQSSGSSPAGGHAWNKILLATEDYGKVAWYVCDTTWGDVAVAGSDGTKKEYLSHRYFLVSDASIAATHEEKTQTPIAESSYNYYKNAYVGNQHIIALDCGNRNEFAEIMHYVVDKKMKGVELRISYSYESFEKEFEIMCKSAFWYNAKTISWITSGNVYIVTFEY